MAFSSLPHGYATRFVWTRFMSLRREAKHFIQTAFFEEVFRRRKTDGRWKAVTAVSCGQQRQGAAAAARLKKEGVDKGIPDVFVAVPAGGYHGLWLTFKSPGRDCSRPQYEKIALLRSFGYKVEIADDARSAIKITETYLS